MFMNEHSILPVLLAGGNGSRLWPLSRTLMPKQFLALNGDSTMLQQTLERVKNVTSHPAVVICNQEHRFIVSEQAREGGFDLHNVILEPFGRNTAPAIAIAAMQQVNIDRDPLLLVMPSDHLIGDQRSFAETVQNAAKVAEDGRLVTFGVTPTHAETGYGYIETGDALSENDRTAFSIQQFVEKPDHETASTYLKSGKHLWNSGIFLLKASVYLSELKQYRPDIFEACEQALANVEKHPDYTWLCPDHFQSCPDDSIDYAVMEKTTMGSVVPLEANWSDLGSWHSLWEVGEKDIDGNVCLGDTLLKNTNNSYVRSESRLVSTVGVDDLLVIETKDAVLIAHKDRVQDVKQVVNDLKRQSRDEHHAHTRVYRPWGDYEGIDAGDRFQVKRITVNPGEQLSLQMHYHRAEHWIVVKGTAIVECDGEEKMLSENQSTYIPIGATHRLRNPGKMPLELIEVQSGSYVGEDDIVRFEDNYGRALKG